MAKEGLTKTTDFQVAAREIDFVTRFARNWDALKQILGITHPIVKENGTTLKTYTATSVNGLEESVGEGEIIPYTEYKVSVAYKEDLTIEKYAKATSIEALNKYGADIAIQKTDDAFLIELQNKVLNDFYSFIRTGTLTSTETTFQMALAMARGKVIDKFNKLQRNVTEIVGFANVLDVFKYIGSQNITIQTAFGLQYVKDFMGYNTLFLLSEPFVPKGTVIATPVENIDLYYINPADSDFKKLGLDYRTDGETNLIGFHANGNYGTAVGEVFALMGMKLWAEYQDGIAVITVADVYSPLTISAETDAFGPLYGGKVASDLQSDIAISDGNIKGTLKYIEGGLSDEGPLKGSGYFLALKWSNPAAGVTSLKVGLMPSIETGLVECLSDTDRNGVFKITDITKQKVAVVQSDGSNTTTQYLALKDLILADPAGA